MGGVIDPRTGLEIRTKRTAESRLFTIDFEALLAGGNLSSVTSVVATNQSLMSGSAALTVGSPIHDSATLAQVRLSAGTDGEDYKVVTTVVDSNANTLVGQGILQVRD